MSQESQSLQSQIRDHIVKHGVSQKHIADECNISQVQFSNWLKYRRRLPPDRVANIQRYLKVYEDVKR